jgi:hypothetical protein
VKPIFGSGIAHGPGDVPRFSSRPGEREDLSNSIAERSAHMKRSDLRLRPAVALMLAFAPTLAFAFSSGSTGADGPFNPTVNTVVTLPPSGIFNYTSVNIPAGVTVSYLRNTTNTPVVILASGDVTIAGILNVGGGNGADVGSAGTGNQGDDGQPGKGGPGGFEGGRGGASVGSVNAPQALAGSGLGPGGGSSGIFINVVPGVSNCIDNTNGRIIGGSGGGFSVGGNANSRSSVSCTGGGTSNFTYSAPGGVGYGSRFLLPLIGGSGGGGGGGYLASEGAGGGGGGGALLIAASGTVNVVSPSGGVFANGGAGGSTAGAGAGAPGGGGSGGGIRIIASTLIGNGTIQAVGGPAGVTGTGVFAVDAAGAGAPGFVRLEADTITRTTAANPVATSDTPGNVFVAGFPTLTISSVAGVGAPATPTGTADITLPAGTPNPVTVVFTTSNVPVGNTVLLKVVPQVGAVTSALSPALTGSTSSATASVSISLPVGPSVLQAQTTFTIVAALGDLLRNFAGNERVEKITLSATLGGKSTMTLITVSGKQYEAPDEAVRIAAMGG